MWIDAICIDQSNLEERSSHASLIAQIYCRASSVIAWVGVQNDETKLAPDAILSILRADGKDPDEIMSDESPHAALLNTMQGYHRSSVIVILSR